MKRKNNNVTAVPMITSYQNTEVVELIESVHLEIKETAIQKSEEVS